MKIATVSEEFHAIAMGLGDDNPNFRECCGNFVCQNLYYWVFGVEMSRIDDGHAQIPGIPKLVVFHIGSDKGITTCQIGIHQFAAAGSAAYTDLGNGFAAISIAQPFTAQNSLYMGKESLQRLFCHITVSQKTVSPSRPPIVPAFS